MRNKPIQAIPEMLKAWRNARSLHQEFVGELFQCGRAAVMRWESTGIIQPRYFIWWHHHTEEMDHPTRQIPGYSESLPLSTDPAEQRAIIQLHAWLTDPLEAMPKYRCPPLFLLSPRTILGLMKGGITNS